MHQATIIDLSVGGARISLARKLAFGDLVTVHFSVPTLPVSEEGIEVSATARWSDDVAVGLQFGSLRAIAMWALGKYLAELPVAIETDS